MKFNKKLILPLLSAAALLTVSNFATAQDKVDKEPIVASIDPAALTYDILVDGNLPADDAANHKFKTLQAAYAAAEEGTEAKPTVIGIKPNVYQLPGGERSASLTITKNWITLLGLTNNRRTVVLADNRGHAEGAGDNGYILDVNCTGFTLRNLTVLNYCNCDYEYPGDPSKNLKMRNPTITQAVAFQSSGDKHVYENVAFLSRLDTCFLRTTRSYLKNVYIEGTDDFIGGGTVAVWEDCEVVFPTGRGVMSAGGVIFINTKFEATRGMEFSKGAGGSDVLINCTMPVNTPQNPVACVRGVAPPRPTSFYLTYHTKDASGKPAVISDGSEGEKTFAYTREMSDEEVKAFNPWNVLRAAPGGGGRGGFGGGAAAARGGAARGGAAARGGPAARGGRGGAAPGAAPAPGGAVAGGSDDWDPSHTRDKYEAAGEGSLIYRMNLANPRVSIRTGDEGATISANVTPARVADKTIKWSTKSDLISLSPSGDNSVVVTGKNSTNKPEWIPVTATAANGAYLNAYVFVEPKYINPPTLSSAPKVDAPANGKVGVSYTLDLAGNEDQSVITWYDCDDASGANAREMATSRGNIPLKQYTLTSGDIGKYLRVSVSPKHQISDPGPAVFAMAASPIAASDVSSSGISPDFRNFIFTPNTAITPGMWTVNGTFTSSPGDTAGYGIRVASQGATLLYQPKGEVGDMQIDLTLTPEKTEGMGFGSPGAGTDGDRVQHCDVYIKYDPVTKNGYALRFWRTTESAEKCMYQFCKITDGAGAPLSDKKAFTGVLKPNTYLMVKVVGSTISAVAHNDVDGETLNLEDTITPNRFGGTGILFTGSVPQGNSIVYRQFKITYPDKKP